MSQGFPPTSDVPPPVPGAAPRPPRPATVTAAVAAMLTVVALGLVGAVISVVARGEISDAALEDALKREDLPANAESVARTAVNVGLVLGVVFPLVTAIGFVALAVFNLRGNNPARIITWVVCGLFLCCGLAAVGGTLGQLEYYPGWLQTWVVGSSVVNTLLYIAIIVLLALPASNAFFKGRPKGQF